MVEVIVADQAPERLTAELAVLGLVDLLEDRALVPRRALELLQRLAEFRLADVHEADLQHLVGLGVVHQVVQTAPGAFQLLEVGVMQDQIDLLTELAVDCRDHRLDRLGHVRADQGRLGQRLLGERAHRPLDGLLGLVGPRLEFLAEQRFEIAGFHRPDRRGRVLLQFRVSHVVVLPPRRTLGRGFLLRVLLRRRERLEERRILQQPAHEFLGAGLAVHVGDQVGELLPCLEQLAQ